MQFPIVPSLSHPLRGLLLTLLTAAAVRACDLCSIYSAAEAKQPAQGLYTGLFAQYSDFATLRQEGNKVENDEDQYVHSAITQVFAGYQFDARLSLQATLPFIRRAYQRPGESGTEQGTASGVGDAVLLGRWRLLERNYGQSLVVWHLLGGLKLPTGDSAHLGDEAAEEEEPAAKPLARLRAAHGDEGSGVHGHDLALGSGSVDAVLGTSGFWGRHRLYASADLQYTLRREGDFHYRYADDLNWSLNPGYFAWLSHRGTLGVGLRVSGEHKGEDQLAGVEAEDTAIDAVYAGPSLAYTQEGRFSAEAALDLPLSQDNSALQIVPNYRLRLGLTGRF